MFRVTAFLFLIGFTSAFAADEPSPELLDLAKQLKAKDAKVRLKAAEALRDKGKDAAPVARELCDALAVEKDKQVTGALLGALDKSRPDLSKPVGILISPQRYAGTAGDVREAVVKLGADGRPLAGILVGELKRATAAEDRNDYSKALLAIKPDDVATITYCKTALTTGAKSPGIVATEALAIYASWAIKDEKNDKELLAILKGYLSKGVFVLPCATWAGEMGARAKPLLPELKKLANSTDGAVSGPALAAVEKIEAGK